MEPLRSLHQFNKPPVPPQIPNGRSQSESVIPSGQPRDVLIFGLWLGLGLVKKLSMEPSWRHHGGCFTEPSRSLRQFVK